MQVYGPAHVHGPQSISAPHTARNSQPTATSRTAAPADEVQISSAGQFLDRLSDVPAIRSDRVAQIRSQLAAGTYLTDEKLSLALDRLLNEIG